ncbi:MAG: aminotransferase class III-fold pyridoxal phosphate-dependent enzyme, partial [Flavisolibacter sp.]|nr:aminotransferase class III-fold pyridoxal phosphate-dependent enzyme [Flavisolibacter sp.]
GKALGGGMPLGAFISDKSLMDQLTDNPVLGHITTFGGHPVCCAAGMAAFRALLDNNFDVEKKAQQFKTLIQNPLIKTVRSFGLWMAIEFESFEICKKIIDQCIEKGLITDWFLFASNCMRISPPLTITEEQIEKACRIINESML